MCVRRYFYIASCICISLSCKIYMIEFVLCHVCCPQGSIYCLGWSPDGNLLATGSNDKTVKLTRFDDFCRHEKLAHTQEVELTMHDGTVRDICFIEDLSNKSSLLVSGGAGDCKIYVTDCVTATPFQSLSGHSGKKLVSFK